jgi:two-component system CheB/CheR fusion protein
MTVENDENVDKKFEALLEYLRQNRGFDFTGYKRSSLMRRVSRRMQVINIQTFEDFLDRLEVDPEEFGHLFDTILINVTAFFRDAAAWDYIGQEIIPRLLASKNNKDPIRIWSAGCASGEEPYSLAIVFAEALGEETFRERVKIYASDVDEEALAIARQGSYTAQATEPLSSERRERFFERSNSRLVFRGDLRRAIIFGRHDLVHDAPISRLDLLVSRNTLMYFNAETQGRIVAGFHFATNPEGFLFLGRAEMLFTHAELRSIIEQAYAERRTVTQSNMERGSPNGEIQVLRHIGHAFVR